MARAPSGKRYAQAIFQIASAADTLEEWSGDLGTLASVLQNQDFSTLLDAPQVSAAQKLKAIRQILNSAIGSLAINFVSILAIRNLVHLVPRVLEEYGRLLDAHRGIERGEVVAAVPLNDEQQRRVSEILENVVGTNVRLAIHVEPSVIGGLIVQIGDRVIDGSLRTRLEEMRRVIVERA